MWIHWDKKCINASWKFEQNIIIFTNNDKRTETKEKSWITHKIHLKVKSLKHFQRDKNLRSFQTRKHFWRFRKSCFKNQKLIIFLTDFTKTRQWKYYFIWFHSKKMNEVHEIKSFLWAVSVSNQRINQTHLGEKAPDKLTFSTLSTKHVTLTCLNHENKLKTHQIFNRTWRK